jgi:hypothetical protein
MNVEISPDAAMAAVVAVDELQETMSAGIRKLSFTDQAGARDLLWQLRLARNALESALAREGRAV